MFKQMRKKKHTFRRWLISIKLLPGSLIPSCNSLLQLYVVYALKDTILDERMRHLTRAPHTHAKSQNMFSAKRYMENVPYENLFTICKLFEIA